MSIKYKDILKAAKRTLMTSYLAGGILVETYSQVVPAMAILAAVTHGGQGSHVDIQGIILFSWQHSINLSGLPWEEGPPLGTSVRVLRGRGVSGLHQPGLDITHSKSTHPGTFWHSC